MEENNFLRYEEQEIEIKMNNEEIKGYIINKLEVNSSANSHTVLNLELEFTDEQKGKYASINQIEDFSVEINATQSLNSQNKTSIFHGICKESRVRYYGNKGYRFIITCYSKSQLMDREKKYRAFQDTNMSYSEIIQEILVDYKTTENSKVEVLMNKKSEEKIKELIVQFDETDWEFLIRIASHLGLSIINTDKSVVCFGFLDNDEKKNEDMKYTNYEMIRDMKNILYKIFSTQVFSAGSYISINNSSGENTFSIISSRIYLDKALLFGEYVLVNPEEYKFNKIRNEKILGNVIEGIVEKVYEKEKIAVMEVRLFEGMSKYGKAYKDYGISRYVIPYSTFYSQTNTGFFCTPEIGDTVDIHFLNREEKFVRASWSVNNKGNGRFSDYTKRNFHVNQGDFKFTIDLNVFDISTAKSYSTYSPSINTQCDNSIVRSTKNLLIASDDYMGIESIGDMSIYGKRLEVIGKEEEVVIEASKEIRLKGEKIHNN